MLIVKCQYSYSQQNNIGSNSVLFQIAEQSLYKKDTTVFSSIKPISFSEIRQNFKLDSATQKLQFKSSNSLLNYLTNNNSLVLRKRKISVFLNPIFNYSFHNDLKSKKSGNESAIGADLGIQFGNKFYGNINYFSGNTLFVSNFDSITKQNHIIPGYGYAYKTGNSYCYQNLSFNLAYAPTENFRIEAGKGNTFLGDGYRSLLLSENSNSYPFLKLTTKVWRLKYVNLFANFKDVRFSDGNKSEFVNKYSSFHYLSWNVTKRINFSFFEAIMWESSDTIENRGFDVNYINPAILYRPVEFSLNSPDNALMGFNLSVKLFKKQVFYGQLLLDDFIMGEVKNDIVHSITKDSTMKYGSWMNKQSFQLGIKSFDLFHIKNLTFQTEYNLVRPYTYSHKHIYESYSNYSQSLAHPFGANFWESVTLLKYNQKRFFLQAKFSYCKIGMDSTNSHFGQNILQPTWDSPTGFNVPVSQYGNVVGQGITTTIKSGDLQIGYLLNPSINLKVFCGITYLTKNSILQNDQYLLFRFGISTLLFRSYTDL